MEFVPAANALVLKLATPPERVAVPMLVPFTIKVTVPVGVPAVVDLTVAVRITAWPEVDGLTDEVSTVVVVSTFVISETGAEVLAVKSVFPA